MSCVDKFVITKGVDNTFVFTIKQDGSTLPMEIEVGDTFTAKLVPLNGDGAYDGLEYELEVTDALSGKVQMVVPADDTEEMASEKGEKADRYYAKPTYKLVIECVTQNNGNFIAKVPLVYVD